MSGCFLGLTSAKQRIKYLPQGHNTLPPTSLHAETLGSQVKLLQTSSYGHTGQCKRTGGCYNELVVAFFSTGGGVKDEKINTC